MPKKSKRALTPEARENQLIALSYDLAEQQLRDGTASSQIQAHFLKLGTAKARLELEKMKQETILIQKKGESLESSKNAEKMFEAALKAIREYSGQGGGEVVEEDDY